MAVLVGLVKHELDFLPSAEKCECFRGAECPHKISMWSVGRDLISVGTKMFSELNTRGRRPHNAACHLFYKISIKPRLVLGSSLSCVCRSSPSIL